MYNCYLETDLNRLEQNIINIRKLYSRPVKVMCVLKANAYGHGIEGISRFLDRSEHTHMFAVANAEEALNLKNSGIQKPVLVLSGVPKEWAEAMITHDIRFTVYDMEDALFIQNTAKRLNKHAFIHVKIDTGMHRVGFIPDSDFVTGSLKKIASMDHIKLEGIMSHFADSDNPDSSYQKEQYRRFVEILKGCKECGILYDTAHISNSAAAISSRQGAVRKRKHRGLRLHRRRIRLFALRSDVRSIRLRSEKRSFVLRIPGTVGKRSGRYYTGLS
jgi:alanine racemase